MPAGPHSLNDSHAIGEALLIVLLAHVGEREYRKVGARSTRVRGSSTSAPSGDVLEAVCGGMQQPFLRTGPEVQCSD